jgi:hypothetical protein
MAVPHSEIRAKLDADKLGGNSGTDGTFPVTSLNRNPEKSAERHTPHSSRAGP